MSYHTEVCCHNFLPLGFSPQSPLGNNGENRKIEGHMLAQDRYRSPLGGATRREGVPVRLASTPDGWQAYYKTYEDSVRRWGKRSPPDTGGLVWGSVLQRISFDTALAGGISGYSSGRCVVSPRKKACCQLAWGNLEKYFALRPVHLLLYECRRLCARKDMNGLVSIPAVVTRALKLLRKDSERKHSGVRRLYINIAQQNTRKAEKVQRRAKQTKCPLTWSIAWVNHDIDSCCLAEVVNQ